MILVATLTVIIKRLIELFNRVISYFSNKLHMYNTIKGIPGPKAYPIIGNAHLFIGDIEDIGQKFLDSGKNYQSLWRLWLGTKLFVIVDNPEYVKMVLNNLNFIEKSEEYNYLKPFVANGLFTAPASVWNPHRKFINEFFLKTHVKSYMDVFVNHSVSLTKKLETLVEENADVFHYVSRSSLDIIYDAMLDTQLNLLTNENCFLAESIDCLLEIAAQRIFKIWLQPNIFFYNSSMGKKFQKCLSYVDNVTHNIIKEKKVSWLSSNINRELTEENTEQKRTTLLDFLFESSYEGEKYSEQDIRDEINTFAIAGSETSATVISFVLLMLATFPDIQDKVHDELLQIYCSNEPKQVPITYDDIKNMNLLERVIKETLRLFPAGPAIARKITQDMKVTENWTIPKGSSAIFIIYKLHRSEKYWPQPLVFDPDRFLPGKNSSTYFFPFSYGRRNCIGQKFAMLEMIVIIATLIRTFKIKIDKPRAINEIEIKMNLSLKPKKPIKLKFQKRS